MTLFVFLAAPARARIVPTNLSHLIRSGLSLSVVRFGCGMASPASDPIALCG